LLLMKLSFSFKKKKEVTSFGRKIPRLIWGCFLPSNLICS